MDAEQHSTVASPGFKLLTVWAAVGYTSWADVAAFLAAIYSLLLIGEWLWKKIGRPFCERHGWIAARLRRKGDK